MASSINDDRGFALVISCNLGNEGGPTYLFLDTCHEKHVEGSSTIPTHPLQNGNTMADHMYRNPDTFSVSGSFGMFGKYANDKNYENVNIGSDSIDRLAKIQSVFEYIKDNGILCTLTTLRTASDGSSETRFKIRKNMALERISWVENQTSMQYSLSFKEIITVKIQEYEVKDDEDLPNIVMPPARTLGQIMIGESEEDSPYTRIVITALAANGYIEIGILRIAARIGTIIFGGIVGISISAAAGLLVLGVGILGANIGAAIAAGLGASAALTPVVPVGTVIAAAATIAIGLGVTVWTIISRVKEQQRRVKAFKLINKFEEYVTKDGTLDEAKLMANINNISVNESEVNRLNKLLIDVKDKILAIESDCMFYAISNGQDDNSPREVVLNIGNRPYYIEFVEDTSTVFGWKMDISTPNNVGDAVTLDGINGVMINNSWCPCTSFDEMDYHTNCIFKDATREYQVYLYNPSIKIQGGKTTEEEARAISVVRKLLCGYYIVVSKGNIQDNVKKIYDAIDSAIRAGGYD